MWSPAVLLVAVTVLTVVAEAAPNPNPKTSFPGERENMLAGRRFQRNCFLRAGGCMGKRTKLPLSINEDLPLIESQDILNSLPLERLSLIQRLHHLANENEVEDVPDEYLAYRK